MSTPYDALLLVSFGGPEGPDDVLPFLENVVRGKDVPRERLMMVATHYERFGGISPINAELRALLTALRGELNAHGITLPVYWGNRNWHPLLSDTLQQMADDGVRHALAFVTSAFCSYPGCRQYLEDIERARGDVPGNAPKVDKLRLFYNHPGFIEAMADRLHEALEKVPADRRGAARVVFSAHSLPLTMAQACDYEAQLREACKLVARLVDRTEWELVYQSRSGPPQQPWLGPDICDWLSKLGCSSGSDAESDVVVVPIGFVCEHMETAYDLDIVARGICENVELNMVRAATVGCHPRFVAMIRELIEERITPKTPRLALGDRGPAPDRCADECCRPQ
jgi:ferrochelatase